MGVAKLGRTKCAGPGDREIDFFPGNMYVYVYIYVCVCVCVVSKRLLLFHRAELTNRLLSQ